MKTSLSISCESNLTMIYGIFCGIAALLILAVAFKKCKKWNIYSIKLISKIEQALKRIQDGTYGFCAETAEPIGLKRLMARPIAELSIAAQEKHEKEEKVYADD